MYSGIKTTVQRMYLMLADRGFYLLVGGKVVEGISNALEGTDISNRVKSLENPGGVEFGLLGIMQNTNWAPDYHGQQPYVSKAAIRNIQNHGAKGGVPYGYHKENPLKGRRPFHNKLHRIRSGIPANRKPNIPAYQH